MKVMKKILFLIVFYFVLGLFLTTVVNAQSIVRTFNSDAFVTAYINGNAYGYDADRINRQSGPRNSCIYESQERTKDGVVIGRDEIKRCHEEVKTGESDTSFIKDFITSPLGETLIVLTSSLLLQRVAAGSSTR
jgi:hypothetical protein